MQMRIGLSSGGMELIFPVCALAAFTPVVLLSGTTGHQLHAAGNGLVSAISYQQVYVPGGHRVAEHARGESFARLEQPAQPGLSITFELQKELTPMTAVRDMPDKAGQKVTVGTWHPIASLQPCFLTPKKAIQAYLTILNYNIIFSNR